MLSERQDRRPFYRSLGVALVVVLLCRGGAAEAQTKRHVWNGYTRTPQHDALADVASQPLQTIRWQTPVDLQSQYIGTFLSREEGAGRVALVLAPPDEAGGGAQLERLWHRAVSSR